MLEALTMCQNPYPCNMRRWSSCGCEGCEKIVSVFLALLDHFRGAFRWARKRVISALTAMFWASGFWRASQQPFLQCCSGCRYGPPPIEPSEAFRFGCTCVWCPGQTHASSPRMRLNLLCYDCLYCCHLYPVVCLLSASVQPHGKLQSMLIVRYLCFIS